jgi:hypothetical protein
MKKAGDFLTAFLDEKLMKKARGYSDLFSSWPAIAREVEMPGLADHTWIRELEKSLLLVEADHPGWVQLLQTKQQELLQALRRRFPEETLSGISFRLSREGPRPIGQNTAASNITAPVEKDAQAGTVVSPAPEQAAPPGPDRQEKKYGLGDIKNGQLREALGKLEKTLKDRET